MMVIGGGGVGGIGNVTIETGVGIEMVHGRHGEIQIIK
jgi:hypothetical protein